jgi:fumarate reductase subunit C
MSTSSDFRRHSSGPYRAQMSRLWWLSRASYVAFVLREVSCVFVAWSVLFLLLLVRAVGNGSDGYSDFLGWADTPWVVALNVIALGFIVYHAVTWFRLTPAAVAVRLMGRRLPSIAIALSAYAAWVMVSTVVGWLLLRG